MPATTVVDQLIVKLGLDPRDFTKGEKQVAADVLKTKEVVRKSSDDMSKSFGKAATSFGSSGGTIAKVFSRGGAVGLALAVAIAAGKKVNDMLYEVAENTRKLGLDARNYNTTAANLRNMGNASELAGGQIEDAANSAASLNKSLFDLKYNGAISDQLVQLGRLGVRFQDAKGGARDLRDIALDTADALGRLQDNGSMTRAEAGQFAQQAGFTGGLANLVADGGPALRAALAKQEARRQVEGGDVSAATGRVNAYLSLGQAAESNIGVPAMTKESPGLAALSRGTESMITGAGGAAGAVGDKLTGAVDKASIALGDFTDGLKAASGAQGAWFRGKYMYGATFESTEKKYGLLPGVLRGIARTESGYDPSAVASKNGVVTGKGLMQLNPKFYPNAGQNPYNDIDTAGRILSGLLDKTSDEEPMEDRYSAALRMYHAGETNYRNGTNLGPANRAYPSKVLAGTDLVVPTPNAQGLAGGGRSKGDVTFENVTIVTPRTDGEGVAGEFVDSARRKINAAQAETGMN